MVLFGPGDKVITHAPYWPTLSEQVTLAEATPVLVRTSAEEGFAIRAQPILDAITPDARQHRQLPVQSDLALIGESDLATIAEGALANDIWIIVDLCYEKLIYDPVPHNLPAVLRGRTAI